MIHFHFHFIQWAEHLVITVHQNQWLHLQKAEFVHQDLLCVLHFHYYLMSYHRQLQLLIGALLLILLLPIRDLVVL